MWRQVAQNALVLLTIWPWRRRQNKKRKTREMMTCPYGTENTHHATDNQTAADTNFTLIWLQFRFVIYDGIVLERERACSESALASWPIWCQSNNCTGRFALHCALHTEWAELQPETMDGQNAHAMIEHVPTKWNRVRARQRHRPHGTTLHLLAQERLHPNFVLHIIHICGIVSADPMPSLQVCRYCALQSACKYVY